MLPKDCEIVIHEVDDQPNIDDAESVVGHADTAAILGVPFNRVTLKLHKDDTLIVAQYDGPRLPEGTTTLPDGASFRWFIINIV